MSDTQQPIGTYDAFGDESVGPDYAVYGTILIDRSRRVEADEIIAQAKITSGAEPSDVLHSRSMFSGQQRQKTPWSQKTMTEVFEICSDLLLRLDDLLVRKIVAVAKKADLPAVIPGGQWKASDPDYIGPLPWADGWAVGDKNIATWCAHGTMFPLSKWPGFNNIQFWPDPDHSLIATEGGRRKFSTQLSSFADHGGGEPTRVDVMYSAESKPALLQIADALAYVTQRCAHGGSSPNDRRFKALIDQMRPERVLVGTTPQGDLGINVPNQVLNFRPN